VLFLITGGCDLFSPRKADVPKGKVTWNHFPINPNQTLDNFITVYNYSENIERYHSILTDGFRFYFDSQDAQDYHIPDFWGKDSEVGTRGLINQNMELSLDIMPEKEDITQADSAIFYRNYRLMLSSNQGDNLFSGSLSLFLKRGNDGFWRIERWDDFRSGNQVTWGRLKYEYTP
jgi:hypothetical protein